MSDYESYEREPRPNRRRRHGSAGWIIFFIIAAAVAWLVVGKQPMSNTSGAGARESGKTDDKNMFKILNRTEAINFAVSRVAKPEDTVVFLGKGHEKTIERAYGEHSWNEREEVEKAIHKDLKSKSQSKSPISG